MYSRRFSENMDLPAGYGGVAMRGRVEEQEEPQGAAAFAGEDAIEKKESFGQVQGGGKREAAPLRDETQRRTLCRPRRPLYSDERRQERHRPPKEQTPCRHEGSDGQGGLLSSLFSLSGKTFTMEDIILAGLILLLLSEKEKGGKSDNELLLILGFLLLGGSA